LRHAPKGLLKKLDRGLLVVWCEAEARHRTAAKALADEGLVVIGSMGQPIASPYVRIVDAAARTMLRAAEQMGFSPASRPRLSVPAPDKPDPESPWAMLRLIPGGQKDPASA
jgi:P27 family predicted phage terminase small subunit